MGQDSAKAGEAPQRRPVETMENIDQSRGSARTTRTSLSFHSNLPTMKGFVGGLHHILVMETSINIKDKNKRRYVATSSTYEKTLRAIKYFSVEEMTMLY